MPLTSVHMHTHTQSLRSTEQLYRQLEAAAANTSMAGHTMATRTAEKGLSVTMCHSLPPTGHDAVTELNDFRNPDDLF